MRANATSERSAPPRRRVRFVLALALAALPLALAAGAAPETASDPAPSPSAQAPPAARNAQKRQSLQGILESRRAIDEEIRERQRELQSAAARGRDAEITQRIRELSAKRDALGHSFSEIAAGIDPSAFGAPTSAQPVDLGQEIRDLLSPLIKELKRATSRPREIDRLRTSIGDDEERLRLAQQGAANVKALLESVEDRALRRALEEEHAAWQARLQEIGTALDVNRQKLASKLGERTTLSETIENIFQLFFRSRGRNLLLALLATVLFLLLLRRLHHEAMRARPFQQRANTFAARVFNLLYVLFMILGGVLVFLIVLYFFGDWVLLILVLVAILGIIWTSKQAIPKFWAQGTLLLNIGPVREGERLVHRGLPFQVQSLNFYTELVNPALLGGRVRLPIGDLAEMRSREQAEGEPWFPTRPGDWVVLADETYGRVELQSIDVVCVSLKGGSRKTYPTAEFLSQRPVNLSAGFRVRAVFGVDYRHRAAVTSEMVEQLEAFVRGGLEASPFAPQLGKLRVGFEEAGASSLDLRIVADFAGAAASAYRYLPRLLQKLCVDAANEHDWGIPFQQLTLHVAPDGAPAPAEPPG